MTSRRGLIEGVVGLGVRAAGCAQGVKRPGLPARMLMRRRLTAYEVGKALVAMVLRQRCLKAGRKAHLEAVERVTIVPRGR